MSSWSKVPFIFFVFFDPALGHWLTEGLPFLRWSLVARRTFSPGLAAGYCEPGKVLVCALYISAPPDDACVRARTFSALVSVGSVFILFHPSLPCTSEGVLEKEFAMYNVYVCQGDVHVAAQCFIGDTPSPVYPCCQRVFNIEFPNLTAIDGKTTMCT